jgi:hypothetical protein
MDSLHDLRLKNGSYERMYPDHEMTPAVFPSGVIARRVSVPTIMAPAHFLGESSYRETVIFLLGLACFRTFPEKQLVVENTFKFGIRRRSYFCRFVGDDPVTTKQVKALEQEMKTLSQSALELQSKFVDYAQCIEMLKATKQMYSVKLVQSLNRPCYRMVGCDFDDGTSFYILQYRSTLHNSKYCHRFRLECFDESNNKFVLFFPHHEDLMDDESKSSLSDLRKQEDAFNQPPAIRQLYASGLEMAQMLNIKCVADINSMVKNGRFKELMLLSEAYHNRQIVRISNAIHERSQKNKNQNYPHLGPIIIG